MAKAKGETTAKEKKPAVKAPVNKATKPAKPRAPRKPKAKPIEVEVIQTPAPVIARGLIGSTNNPRAILKRKHEKEN